MAPRVLAAPLAERSPEGRLGETVGRLVRSWIRMGREEARSLGLSLPQLFLLGGLRRNGGIPVTRWVEMFGVSPSAATSLLDGLEAGGYVVRSHDVQDRRQVLVSLTPQGQKLADRLSLEFQRRWSSFCEEIPGERLLSAAETLEMVLARMQPRGAGTAASEGAARPRRRAS